MTAPPPPPKGPTMASDLHGGSSALDQVVRNAADGLIQLGREEERRAVLFWLTSRGMEHVEPFIDGPRWKRWLFMARHPFLFARAVTLANAAIEINDLAHLKSNGGE